MTSPRPAQAGGPRSTATDIEATPPGLPVLWHLKLSNYNEKARFALDYKNVAHIRRTGMPGYQPRVAKQLTGGEGRTFPVLVLDGEAICDSTRIIAALERRFPDPPLYPADPAARRRALELEEYFDENLGAEIRLVFVHLSLGLPDVFLGSFVPELSGARRMLARLSLPAMRPRLVKQFGINASAVERARVKIRASGERFRAELQPSGYLVGDAFTVADLSLAALLAPIVAPPQFPYPQPHRDHPSFAEWRDLLAAYGLLDWTREIYTRHRGSSAEVVDGDTDRLYRRLPA